MKQFSLACLLGASAACSSSGPALPPERVDQPVSFWKDLWGSEPEGPRLVVARMDKAGRMLILARDLDVQAQIREDYPLPYSPSASGGVWVGTDFPYEKAIKLIGWARNYYTGLRYVALSDRVHADQRRFDQELFIGGATEAAVGRLQLQTWTDSDWRALFRASSETEFHDVIRARYAAPPAN